jgi:single-strand DNA-binding protein
VAVLCVFLIYNGELFMLNNRVLLKGNLTRDPEYKNVSDKELVTFRVAVNEQVGNGREETLYLDVDGWGSHADYSRNVDLSKGDRVIIDGRLRQRSWEDKEGNNRVSYSVLPSTFSKVVKPVKA